MRFAYAVLTALALTMIAPAARAQTPPPAALPAAPPGGPEAPPSLAPRPAIQAPPEDDESPPRRSAPLLPGPRALLRAGAKKVAYEDGDPVPYRYHRAQRFRTGLIITGAVAFGTGYTFIALLTTMSSDKSGYVPIAGPFIHAARGVHEPDPGLSILTGVAQTLGAAMLITGFVWKKEVLLRDDHATVRVTPMGMGYGGMGIGIVGAM
jgi:hypothetical protein